MSNFEQFLKNLKKEESAGIEIDVTARCQICPDVVDTAQFFPNEKILVWWCSSGHRSYIEEFSI